MVVIVVYYLSLGSQVMSFTQSRRTLKIILLSLTLGLILELQIRVIQLIRGSVLIGRSKFDPNWVTKWSFSS